MLAGERFHSGFRLLSSSGLCLCAGLRFKPSGPLSEPPVALLQARLPFLKPSNPFFSPFPLRFAGTPQLGPARLAAQPQSLPVAVQLQLQQGAIH